MDALAPAPGPVDDRCLDCGHSIDADHDRRGWDDCRACRDLVPFGPCGVGFIVPLGLDDRPLYAPDLDRRWYS